MKRSLTLAIFAAFLIMGCGSVNSPSYDTVDNGDPDLSGDASVFPHGNLWNDPAGHGKYVIDKGISACQNACHGESLEGGSARGCKTCHAVYPHKEAKEWQGLSGHGKYVLENDGPYKCATKCHGEDLAGGYDPQGKKSCNKCHKSYPHPSDWEKAPHGAFVKGSGSYVECTTMCHRDGVPEELAISKCSNCHDSYPHGDKWKDAANHGALAKADIGSCVSCHKDITSDCRSCHHDNVPDWTSPAGHGAKANEGTRSCKVCHGSGILRGFVKKGCSDCHKGYPHGVKWEDAANHGALAKADINGCVSCHDDIVSDCGSCHHDNVTDWASGVHGTKVGEDTTGCETCHGSDLSGGLSGKACNSCHSYISHKWEENHHGEHVLTADDKFSTELYSSDCQFCHGELYALNNSWPSGPLETENGTPTCYSCHKEYPHYLYTYSADAENLTWVHEDYGHLIYIFNNQKFDDPDPAQVVKVNCGGGTNGLCHNGVRHRMDLKYKTSSCNILCHAVKP